MTTTTQDPFTIPKFLRRKGNEAKFAAASTTASKRATLAASSPPLSPDDQEIINDARKMLVPASVINEPVSKQLYLTTKHGKELRAAERLATFTATKPPRVPKRASREGLVTVASIAKELGIIPRIARHALRSLKISKPSAGWAFTAEQATQMKAKIAAFLAQPAAPKSPRKSPKKTKEKAPCTTPSNTSTGKKPRSKRALKKRATKR